MTDAAVPALTLPAPVVNALLAGEQVIDLRVQPDAGAGPGRVRIDGWAELRGAATTVVDEDTADGLNGKTVLALGPFAGREVLVLALRAHRLVEPVTAPADLAGLPTDPADGPPSEPALSEAAFDARRLGVENALPRPLAPPG